MACAAWALLRPGMAYAMSSVRYHLQTRRAPVTHRQARQRTPERALRAWHAHVRVCGCVQVLACMPVCACRQVQACARPSDTLLYYIGHNNMGHSYTGRNYTSRDGAISSVPRAPSFFLGRAYRNRSGPFVAKKKLKKKLENMWRLPQVLSEFYEALAAITLYKMPNPYMPFEKKLEKLVALLSLT